MEASAAWADTNLLPCGGMHAIPAVRLSKAWNARLPCTSRTRRASRAAPRAFTSMELVMWAGLACPAPGIASNAQTGLHVMSVNLLHTLQTLPAASQLALMDALLHSVCDANSLTIHCSSMFCCQDFTQMAMALLVESAVLAMQHAESAAGRSRAVNVQDHDTSRPSSNVRRIVLWARIHTVRVQWVVNASLALRAVQRAQVL